MKRGISIGLDIGSNSVGSAWVDEDHHIIEVGCSVFPAGVEETDSGRGAPKNQSRREKRSARRNIARRSCRKRTLRRFLIRKFFLPRDVATAKVLLEQDPWTLRQTAMTQPIQPHQFGRVLLHLAQRRGAAGLRPASDDDDDSAKSDSEGPIKEAIDVTRQMMADEQCQTFGQLVALISVREATPVLGADGKAKIDKTGKPVLFHQEKVRNSSGKFRFHADREMIRDEFRLIWEKQKSFTGPLAAMLTDDLLLELDRPQRDEIWRHQGLLFQQRNTYWDVGTLGRCDLEPSDRVTPFADYHASRFRVIEYVNNIRIRRPGCDNFEPLTPPEHEAVVKKLGLQKTAKITTIRTALKIDSASLKKTSFSVDDFALNLERDELRPPNTDWFARAIINEGLIGSDQAEILHNPSRLDRFNRAILRFDPSEDTDAHRLFEELRHLKLSDKSVEAVIAGWRTRPKLENRSKLSRRAIRNLLPYMLKPTDSGHWRTQIEARRAFADDSSAIDATTGKPPSDQQRERYRLGTGRLNSAARHYLTKHPEQFLPLPPVLSNPVVRKAIYEVRRHIIAYLKRHEGQRPERIVIEFAREATKPAVVNDRILARNRTRDLIRRKIREEIIAPAWGANFNSLTQNQLKQAELRVLLCRQQRGVCAYSLDNIGGGEFASVATQSGRAITPRQAALGNGLEIDHIVPVSRSGDNSLNNRALCYIDSNREKGNRTLREWWGDNFDDRVRPLRFMENIGAPRGEYFETRDYAKKWKNVAAENVASQWKGSQLSDTAYAAREVQDYLESALWPNEPSQAAGGKRRIFVTRGGNTANLRRDWQLYQQADPEELPPSPEEFAKREAKNRGDHREHALDAVVIALTSESRLQSLADDVTAHNQAWTDARRDGNRPKRLRRQPLAPPWGDVRSFRHQVLSLIYPEFGGQLANGNAPQSLVVCHRAVGRKLTGKLHKESLFGPAPNVEDGFKAKKAMKGLSPAHLRLPVPESRDQAIARLAQRYSELKPPLLKKDAKEKAVKVVDGKGFVPLLVDPPAGISGLISDVGLRHVLRRNINQRLTALGIPRDADSFKPADLKKILSDDYGPFAHSSGVPIKSFRLLRTMKRPILIRRREFDYETMQWITLESTKSIRAHLGGNNHHLEIRENARGKWSGTVVSMSDASDRAKRQGLDPVDRSSDDLRGIFVMSLAIGEIVYMRDKVTEKLEYFVVAELNTEKKTAGFVAHWDARRDKGEKDEDNNVIEKTIRKTVFVSPAQMQGRAPKGYSTPVKVMVSPLGDIHPVEPHEYPQTDLQSIDPFVLEVAREGLSARRSRDPQDRSRHRRHGSWSWMRAKLQKADKGHLVAELSAATRLLTGKI